MKINVIGLGYIGFPTALMLSANGNHVIGTDKNNEVVKKLNNGIISFEEKGMAELFNKAKANGICFSNEYQKADVYIVSVPTPYIKISKKVDASYVENAVKEVFETCDEGAIIVIESTISPGTIERKIKPIVDNRLTNKRVHLVHAPERIIPGNMIKELENNNRTIGADDIEIGNKIKKLYKTFCKGEIVVTDIKTAEMTKVVENTYRDINIAYANELAKICRSDNMDVYKIIKIANMHPRVNILNPGPGVGGHCISVDPWFLVGDYSELAKLINTARTINDSMPEFVLERISSIMDLENISDISRIGLYGLTYKENVDDIRESPTMQLLTSMKKHLARGIKVYDPYVKNDIVENQYHNLDDFLNDIDMVVIMVGHNEIKENLNLLSSKVVLDTRNICDENVYKL
jgi:UDP-N-acetyl-D-mannosaminuronic acid dehydrogenase